MMNRFPKRQKIIRSPAIPQNQMYNVTTLPKHVQVIVIELGKQRDCLSKFLDIGRMYHGFCRNSYIERWSVGYYWYQERNEWKTDALAAIYAGAFGKRSVEKESFSFGMAQRELSFKLGIDLKKYLVEGLDNRYQPILNEVVDLVAVNGANREQVSNWLKSIGM